MRTLIVDRADFAYVAELEPISEPPGHYSLSIASIWRQAKNPTEERVKLNVLITRDGLLALRGLINKELSR